MTTIKDIARLSGYSIGTVSRVINQHSDVSPEARKKIEKIIAQENFQPNSNAKLLKQQIKTSVIILVKGQMNIFLEVILEEMQKILNESGEATSVTFLDEAANEVETAVHQCAERKPRGIIFLGGNINYFKKSFDQIDVPSVLVTVPASGLPFENLSSYATDDIAASAAAVEYLVRMGHKNIGIIGGSASLQRGQIGYRRLHGAINQLKKFNIPFDINKQYEPGRFSIVSGYESAMSLLKRNKKITALYCISDIIAIGAMRAVKDLNMNVPDDISIIGYDGIEYTRYSVPRLATIQQDTSGLARKSVEDLLMRINYQNRTANHEMIPFRVLTGESIKKK
ncbi:MAG: LacI family transcriptional regulator [Solobacterium sp.]|jgi:LacI family transcriptional regulator|nr:LacI family transcriptional regulator [Solobacterium sp.]MCH4206302.1 LacI family transcriptional regulator [Solobacterium sp.]MCH4227768.1 LacI family transcriptional regulator [Solobacterium sp.]MCH4283191.1 LacI family transcriptional regulator [Solobacterium sp.]